MKKQIGIFILGAVLLTACGLESYPGGDLPTSARLSAVKSGDSKEKVVRILGTPATENIDLSDGTSFVVYAQNLKSSRAFMEPKEVQRDIYIYYFDTNDKLAKSNHLTLDDARRIAYDSSETRVEGRELSLLDQIVQNFGRYNTGAGDSSVRH
ncbi:MAG: outer membrane protein assembly factor BamE [Pseudomonadota bacterium]|nr:outer membrane protein assembly factor BamE [Pseudomonadota bacterium]